MPNETMIDGRSCEDGADGRAHPLPPGVETGSEIRARGERWIVQAIVAHDDCTELHLCSVTDGGGRVLLWPFDRPAAQTVVRRLRSVRLRRWWRGVASLSAAARMDGLCARAAGARVLAYQLDPALAVAHGTARVLLADEVGLGKTVQAGWIISDMVHRYRHARVLVAVPAGLRGQWQSELRDHFAIDSRAADAAWLRRSFAELPADVDPWSLPGVYVTSIDFLKRTDVLRSLERQLWDALIVDEAHAAAAPTERHAALAIVASRARVVVLITATPFSGDTAAFASLSRLGTMADDPPLMFRRSRDDVGESRARRHRFAVIRISAAERRLQRLLERYTTAVWNTTSDEGARLAMTVLRKRALSSPGAVARSLDRRRELLAGDHRAPQQLMLFDDESVTEDDEPVAALSAPGLPDEWREHRWLTQLAAAAHAAPDSKREYLVRLIRRLGRESAIVFTEYRDTLGQLATSFPGCLTLNGSMSTAARAEVQAEFNEHGGVLLATDAASEGLNLQRRCRVVICYELPWNPARLEQRIGRVDRIGQSRRVHAVTLVARDTAEDLVIARLARRLARVAATLGERDRLAGFLTDARTAGIVIGGKVEETPEATTVPRLTMAPATTDLARQETVRLSSDTTHFLKRYDGCIRVSSIRGSPILPPGFVFAFLCSANAGDGHLVDAHTAFVHVRDSHVLGPRSATDARNVAWAAIERYEHQALATIGPNAGMRLAHVRRVHEGIVGRLIAREVELRDWNMDVEEVQPGLFDRRAVTRAKEDAEARRWMRLEHDQRISALARTGQLTPRCDLVAVLVVHGGTTSGSLPPLPADRE